MTEDEKKNTATAQIEKMQRAADGKQAMAEYEAAAVATRAKTERLRALRLAREATEAKAAPAKKSPGRKSTAAGKTAKAGRGGSATLAEWMEDQRKDGRA